MALLNIGFVAFAVVYAWLPQWVGRPLYSEGLGKVHIWGTFVFATANSVAWLIQGLDGAPRRFAVLPDRWDTGAKVGAAFAIGIGVFQLPFFWNIIQTIRGKVRAPKPATVAGAEAALVLVVLALLALTGIVGYLIGHYTTLQPDKKPVVTQPSVTTTEADDAGKQVFVSSSCGGCHTLRAADSTGTVGPNLDDAKPSRALVVDRVTNGKGAMPPFKSTLTKAQIDAVADFVSGAAG
jgi:mono/diheme cytochrome c family protein